MAKMLTYILPLEGGGVCVDMLYLLIFLQRSRSSFHSMLVGTAWKGHRRNKIGVSFNPRAATDTPGWMKTCLWQGNWQECEVQATQRSEKLINVLFSLTPTLSLSAFSKCPLRSTSKKWETPIVSCHLDY